MPIRVHVPLPGPFTYGVDLPSVTKPVGEAARLIAQGAAVEPVERPTPGGTVSHSANWPGRIALGLVLIALLALALAGFAGFRL